MGKIASIGVEIAKEIPFFGSAIKAIDGKLPNLRYYFYLLESI